jgi:hypothetical protein
MEKRARDAAARRVRRTPDLFSSNFAPAMYRRACRLRFLPSCLHVVPELAPAQIRSIIVFEGLNTGEAMMTGSIEEKLQLAQLRERKARARTARLRRSLDQANRRTRNQTKYVLGAALLALAESGKGEQMIAGFRRWLDRYLNRQQDRDVLHDTPFSLEAREAEHELQ